ncbi:hypothetical protein [Pseudomonas asplenii]|uniref:Uncharacterized protein n=1 Tax=Pseudomonas asplenii TaxID=53407 RepID=A0A1H6NM49_9PSED|nr:hypothetical protein [Pseudomonas fuscovaginae]SEI13353.1 hypothetical protein SAMN05216581_2607 [Pseudomonas fuscovaginae]
MHELLIIIILPEGMAALLAAKLSHRRIISLLLGFEVMTVAHVAKQIPIEFRGCPLRQINFDQR